MVGKIDKVSFLVFSYNLIHGSRGALVGGYLFILLGCQLDMETSPPAVPQYWYWDTCSVRNLLVRESPEPDSAWKNTLLPHRILLPDQAIWYAAKVKLVSNHYLLVDADDGAQVFFNGVQIPPTNGYYYQLPHSQDSVWLAIRVLNNAMFGGLREVKWIEKENMDLVWDERNAVLEQLEEIYLTEQYRSDVFLPPDNFQLHAGRSTKFTVWGDSQGGWNKFQALCNLMLNIPRLEFSIGLGDLVSDGASTAQWFSFMTCLVPLIERRVKVFPLPGNHDYDGYYDDLIPHNYIRHILGKERPTYTCWTAGPAIFLALDPNGSFPLGLDADQYHWAMEKMNSKAWKQARWRFVLIHQPPYAQGWPGYQGDRFIRSFIDEHAEKDRIDFVLSGHCHDFEYLSKNYGNQRTNFIISGGGGGSLEPDENDREIKMDTVINIHHYLLFELDETKVNISMFDEMNHLVWANRFPTPKP